MSERRLFYIASKVAQNEAAVRALAAELERRGYENAYDWTTVIVEKPFADNAVAAHEAAEQMAHSVMHADLIVVLCAENGLGLHIETGGAPVVGIILQFIAGQKKKRILIVGKDNERSIFYFHNSVERFATAEEALATIPAA